MQHYICKGRCKGVSDNPDATCQAKDCDQYQHVLTPCECADGRHEQAYEQTKEVHYVCTGGCRGVSDDPNITCQAQDCDKYNCELVACHCKDSQHSKAYNQE